MTFRSWVVDAAMGTKLPMPNWDDILILGAQLDPMPLDEHANVNTTTVIGKHAKKTMILENPVYVSHMSFGALSKEAKVSLARGTALAHSAMCSGEGGILPKEMESAEKYIFEYVGNLYSVTPENLRNEDAIEIKIGQGTKPGMGGHLPAERVTNEISKIRNKPMGADAVAVASAALMALACQQYRICGTGMCPVGVATQDEELRKRLNGDVAALRVANFLNVTLEELKTFARITGHENLHDLSVDDLCTINREISEFTNIPHA